MFNQNKSMRFLYWILVGILSFLFLYLLTILFPFYEKFFTTSLKILMPFIISGIIAYLLHPIVEKLHRFHFPRWLAILTIYILFFGGVGFGLYKAYPLMINQLNDLDKNLPQFIDMYRNTTHGLYEKTAFLPEAVHKKMDDFFYDLEEFVGDFITNSVKQLTKIMDVVVVIAVIPVLVFYFLKDFKKIQSSLWKLTPKKYREEGKDLAIDIDKSLGNYIRGQLLVCLFVGLTSYGLLWLIGMKYPLLLGLTMGITNIIPYFGPLLGAIPALIIAFTISMKMVVFVILSVFIVQIIEGNLLSPFIVGKSIDIHPIIIIFALIVGGEIGGVVGMIVAVPVLSVIKVFIIHINAYRYNN
ncbi:AI-2E family transporter [Aquibacillus salsiterrae]|uniref:AI-2E family transporter n=1 Tax=Aquibacillus salsiterrae TaxID=2950439 RepID=A0A9X4ADM9_9BACI|nr:AI-2E family transporter [Aquibacillus salsiterrae]MDC3415616.1 AI-2E family transporter [Aquibacillus salsiterrae]